MSSIQSHADRNKSIYLILDNLRSMQNVGAIFRTADAVGVTKLYLCGITPKPPRVEIDKTALGAVDSVDWEYRESAPDLVRELKERKISIISLEQSAKSINFNKVEYKKPLAIIVGNEVDGVSQELLDLSDIIVEIPMFGKKNSLNVAVAAGIILYKAIEE